MIITIISSMRFQKEIIEQTKKLSLEGHIVFSPVICSEEEGILHNDLLVDLYKQKIAMSNKVLVLNVGGYISDGGREAIGFCQINNILVEYLEALPNNFGMNKGEVVKTMIYKGTNLVEAKGCYDMLRNKKLKKEPMVLTGTSYSVQVLEVWTLSEENILNHETDYEVSFKGIVL